MTKFGETGKSKHLLGLLALAIGLSACTEERAFEDIYKGDLVLKSKATVCDPEEKYLYVPSTVEASRTTTASRPHWMGEAKIVSLICDETQIRVVEVDPEKQFNDNPANKLPVLTIPIRHVDYKCQEDQDGKCTNKEVENDDVSWKQKKFVQFLPEQMSVQEVNWLPEQITNLFFPCFTPTGEHLVKADFEDDAINIKLQRSYKSAPADQCISEFTGLNTLGFNVNYHYSLVKLSSIADPNYKKLEYTPKDETTFGFFNTETLKLDVDNNDIVDSKKVFINRWSPGKQIVYQLNSAFQKPENKKILEATQVAVQTINNSLKQAGTSTRIVLKEAGDDLMTGDIRVNAVVLEDDPLAMGVIGYGPSAANPETGEILHARLVMYLGTIRKFIKQTYDEMVLNKIKEKQKEGEKKSGDKIQIGPQMQAEAETKTTALESLMAHAQISGHRHAAEQSQSLKKHSHLPVNEKLLRDHATNPLNHKISRTDFLKNPEDLILMKNCFFSADMLDFNSSLDQAIEKLIADLGLKTWAELSEEERARALDVLTPFVWTPVFVHEMGHNLGLRHNFAGSEDKDNFYSEAELDEMGVKRAIQYSSVMDYSYSTINELPVMGKYDVAALQFGYAEKIALKDGSVISVDEFHATPEADVKAYRYCTDEHVSVNPNCNRFDEGTNFTEMAQHHIRAYKESYAKNNFRNERRNFSLMHDKNQLARLDRTLGSLRRIFERYESIKHTFGLADDNPAWESMEFLKDLKGATKITAEFLVSILQTPDTMCAISMASKPSQIVALVPILQLSPSAIDCFDKENVQLRPEYMVVGQAGKSFQSRKDPHSTNRFVDQIDVRGIWLDKLVALDTLVGRTTGISTFDEFTDNFMDIAEVGPAVDASLRALVLNQVVAPVEIQTLFGNLTVNLPVNMFADEEQMNGHRVVEPLDDSVAKILRLPKGHNPFQKVVVRQLKSELPSAVQIEDPSSLLNALQVVKLAPSEKAPASNYVSTQVGLDRYVAHKGSSVAAEAVSSHRNLGVLAQLSEEQIKKVIDSLAKGEKQPKDATALEKSARAMGQETLQKYLDGEMQSKIFYSQMVQAMSN